MAEPCPFCEHATDNLWFENEVGLVIRDGFPISKGHTLVIPKSHVSSFFDLELEIQEALWKLVSEVRHRLAEELQIRFAIRHR